MPSPDHTSAAPALAIDELVVRYGSFTAVDRLTLAVAPGEIVALLGPNGAGKTTTVETVEGFRRPASGAVRVFGLDPVADHDAVMARLGVMLQSARLYAAIRPIEAIRLFASYHRHPVPMPDELLERVGLAGRARTPWRRLSGGEQQRLALALALVGRPRVVILDEPTAGLDVEGRHLVRDLLRELRAEGLAILLTTHELDEAERVADRVAIVAAGRLVADGTVAQLAANASPTGEGLWFRSSAMLDISILSAHFDGSGRVLGGGEYVIDVAPDTAAVGRLAALLAEQGADLLEFRAAGSRLEDVYRRLVEEATR